MNPRTHRRGLSGLAIAAVIGVAVTGCGTAEGGASTELTEEDVTLTLSWWGADQRTQLTNEAIALFEEEYPNITVEAQFADWTGYWDRLATTAAAGDMPDVSQFDQLYLASYAGRGSLLDLSSMSSILDTSVLPDEILDSGRVNETLYAVPTGATPNGVIVNRSLFEQYGVELPDLENWTWDEFLEVATALTDASGGDVHGVTPFGNDSFSLTVWARQQGDELFDAEGNVDIEPDTVASYFERELEWIEAGAAPTVAQLSETTGVTLDQSDLVTGRTAMGFIPAGQYTAYRGAAPDFDYTIADWPTDADTADGFQYLKPSMYWAASAQSDYPAEAALLIDFLTTDERVGALFGTDRGVPSNPAFQEVIESDLDVGGREALDFTASILEVVGDAAPITPNGASDIETIISRLNQEVLFGDRTPDEAAQELVSTVQQSIDAAA